LLLGLALLFALVNGALSPGRRRECGWPTTNCAEFQNTVRRQLRWLSRQSRPWRCGHRARSHRYLAWISDADLRRVIAEGRSRTAMPAFAASAGGTLSDKQVDALVAGIRSWAAAGFRSTRAHPLPSIDPGRSEQAPESFAKIVRSATARTVAG